MAVIAHFSDLHLDGTSASEDRVRRVVEYLVNLPGALDAVLVTGDVTDRGTDAEYHRAREVLRPLRDRLPVLLCPGNHDVRELFRGILLPQAAGPGGAPINEVHTIADHTILTCDSSVPGHSWGRLGPETLAWLDSALGGCAGRAALIAFHHPPVALGLPYLDSIGLRNADQLAEIVRQHPHVVAVLCGHAHTAAATTFAGRPLLCAPGVASTALAPWDQEPGDRWKRVDPEPSLTFHLLDGGRLTSHTRTLPPRSHQPPRQPRLPD